MVNSFFPTNSEYDICMDKYEEEVEKVNKSNEENLSYCTKEFSKDIIGYRDCVA
jgi:hypothetical protein